MEGALAIIFIFGSIATIIIALSYFKSRRIERTALIAAGKDASIFEQFSKKSNPYLSLKYGMFLVGLALGVILGAVLDTYTAMDEVASYFSMVLAFGGLSLILFYLIQRKLQEQDKQE